MLSAMFSGRIPPKKDENGLIFIDRDAKHFNRILNFLRDGTVGLPEIDTEVKELKIEAQYYCIEDLVKPCDDSVCEKRKNRKRKFEKLDRIALELSILNAKKWGTEDFSMYHSASQNQRLVNALYDEVENNPRPNWIDLDLSKRPGVPVVLAAPDVIHHDNNDLRLNNENGNFEARLQDQIRFYHD